MSMEDMPVARASRGGLDGSPQPGSAGEGASKPLLRNPFVRESLSARMILAVAAGAAVLALAEPTAASLLAGLPLVLAGEALRLWAAGHLRKSRELVTSGPYAWVRHPLYAGTLLASSGFLVMAGSDVALVGLPLFLAFFFGYYLPYKTRVEDGRLARRHDRYAAWRRRVPSVVPRRLRRAVPSDPARRWSFERVRENDEVGTAFLVVLVGLLLALRAVVAP